MSIRTWAIKKLLKNEDLDWIVDQLKGIDGVECVATGQTTINWTDTKKSETIEWFFMKNTITGKRWYRYVSYGDAKRYSSHEKWLGPAEKYVETGIIPTWAEAVDFQMLKN